MFGLLVWHDSRQSAYTVKDIVQRADGRRGECLIRIREPFFLHIFYFIDYSCLTLTYLFVCYYFILSIAFLMSHIVSHLEIHFPSLLFNLRTKCSLSLHVISFPRFVVSFPFPHLCYFSFYVLWISWNSRRFPAAVCLIGTDWVIVCVTLVWTGNTKHSKRTRDENTYHNTISLNAFILP